MNTHTKFELPPTAVYEPSNVFFFNMTKFQEYFWLQYTWFKRTREDEEAARNEWVSVKEQQIACLFICSWSASAP